MGFFFQSDSWYGPTATADFSERGQVIPGDCHYEEHLWEIC